MRVREWLKQQNYHILPTALLDIVLGYSYMETILVVVSQFPHPSIFLSFCAGLDEKWMLWDQPYVRLSHPVTVVNKDRSIVVSSSVAGDLAIFQHGVIEKSQNNWNREDWPQKFLYSILHMGVLQDRVYLLGVENSYPWGSCFISFPTRSTSKGDLEVKVLRSPLLLKSAMFIVVPPGKGKSFETDVDTTISGVV